MKFGRWIAETLARVPALARGVRHLQFAMRRRRCRSRSRGAGPLATLPAGWLPADPDLLHIVVVGHEATRSGAPQAVLRLVRHARSQPGCAVRVVLLTGGPLEQEFHAAAPTITVPAAVSAYDALAANLARGGARCVVVCNTIATADVAVACHARGIPVVSWIHEHTTVIEQYFGGRSTAQAMAAASAAIVVPTEAVRREICGRYQIAASKVQAIANGVDPPRPPAQRLQSRAEVRRELGIPPRAPIVICVGRAELRKGTDLFVQAAARVIRGRCSRGDPEDGLPHFVWVGGRDGLLCGWTDHDIGQLGPASARRIHFVGEQIDPYRYLAAADVFLLTSREETGPLVALEAAAHGLPVVHFDGPIGVKELLLPSEATVVPYLDLGAMTAKVDEWLDHGSGPPAVAEPVHARISWEQCSRRVLELVVSNGGTAARRQRPTSGVGAARRTIAGFSGPPAAGVRPAGPRPARR